MSKIFTLLLFQPPFSNKNCQAQFQLASSVQVQLRSLLGPTHPPQPKIFEPKLFFTENCFESFFLMKYFF